jgi:hypothetical protein
MVRDVSIGAKPDNATWYYHHPEYGYNCAQAMVKHFGGSEKDISEMRVMGSGRAPESHCGALHGALFIMKEEQEVCKEIIKKFTQKAGSPFCRTIRKAGTTSCHRCVEIADSVVKEIQNHP